MSRKLQQTFRTLETTMPSCKASFQLLKITWRRQKISAKTLCNYCVTLNEEEVTDFITFRIKIQSTVHCRKAYPVYINLFIRPLMSIFILLKQRHIINTELKEITDIKTYKRHNIKRLSMSLFTQHVNIIRRAVREIVSHNI